MQSEVGNQQAITARGSGCTTEQAKSNSNSKGQVTKISYAKQV
jgi:hypothetical protein